MGYFWGLILKLCAVLRKISRYSCENRFYMKKFIENLKKLFLLWSILFLLSRRIENHNRRNMLWGTFEVSWDRLCFLDNGFVSKKGSDRPKTALLIVVSRAKTEGYPYDKRFILSSRSGKWSNICSQNNISEDWADKDPRIVFKSKTPLYKKVIFPFWVIILILTDYILRFQVNEDSLYYFFEKIDPLPSTTMVKYCDIKSFFSILVFSESSRNTLNFTACSSSK